MALFSIIEGESIILSHKGLYKQVDLCHRNNVLYAKWSGGFIKLAAEGYTSKPDIRIVYLTLMPEEMGRDKVGYLVLDTHPEAIKLTEKQIQQLIVRH